MSQIYNIYGDLNVQYSSTSVSLSSTTISGGTFYGTIDAKYIGSGNTPNWVTNQEFTYLSGLTGYAQTQINSKISKETPLLLYSGNNLSNNTRLISGGTNILTSSSSTYYTISAKIGSLEVGVVSLTTSGSSNYTLNNLNITGFESASHIKINPTKVIKITGLSGGTSGKMITITNVGQYLIILENLSTGSTSSNRFSLNNGEGWYLLPNNSISLIYDTSQSYWINIYNTYRRGLSFFEDFYGLTTSFTPATTTTSLPSFNIYGTADSITKGMSYRQDTSSINGCLKMGQIGTGSLPSTPARIRVGLPSGAFSGYDTNTGTTLLCATKLIISNRTAFNYGPLINPVLTFGTENNSVTLPYTATTNNNTTPPSLSGGSYWLLDYSGNPNYLRYVVQTTGNSTQILTSTLPVTSLISVPSEITNKILGVYVLPTSGDTLGSSTFFWADLTGSVENYVIEPPITHTGGTITGNLGINYYSGYNYQNATNLDSSMSALIDFLGFTLTKL
jgi:hypothetical protein